MKQMTINLAFDVYGTLGGLHLILQYHSLHITGL